MFHRLSFVVVAGFAFAACGGAASSDLFGPSKGDPAVTEGDAATLPEEEDASIAPPGEEKDAQAPTPVGKIKCAAGGAACAPGGEVCCRREIGLSVTLTCTAPEACGGGLGSRFQFPIRCDDTEDCAALGLADQVCCLTLGGFGGDTPTDVSCRPKTECTGKSRTNLCANTGDCFTSGKTCKSTPEILRGYSVCLD
jgi:hypothetical protein